MKSKTKIIRSPKQAERKLDKIADRLNGEDTVKVGLPKDSNAYPDGTSVIMVAAVHEFGSQKINVPQRSFLRSTVQSNKRRYTRIMIKLGASVLSGKTTPSQALEKLGLFVQTDVQSTIRKGVAPALKSREGTALWKTGHLIESITYEVS